MTTTTNAASIRELPDEIRVPLDSLHADADYLASRALAGSLTKDQIVGTIRERIDAAKNGILAAISTAGAAAGRAGDPAKPRDDSDQSYDRPIGYLPACELERLRSGHSANLRSARFGPSALDADVPVYLQPSPVAVVEEPTVHAVLTADDLKELKNGTRWRVEWWNESCRMMLPADMRLDSFQAYKNGTLMFTIKAQPLPPAPKESKT